MKKIVYVLPIMIVCFFLVGCTKNIQSNFTTGAIGKIEFGSGDCMPCPCSDKDCSGCPKANYNNFIGEVFFIQKDKLDSLKDGGFDALIESSVKTSVIDGNYKISLEPGEYVVTIKEVYSVVNLINITQDKITEQDFKFFKCMSY